MSSKRKASEFSTVTVKRQKKSLTLLQKVEILDRLAKGEGSTAVARDLGLNEATVRTVKKNDEKIRSSVAASAPKGAKVCCYTRDTTIQQMEKALILWIEDHTQKGIALDGVLIREAAKRLYDHLKLENATTSKAGNATKDTPFLASKGWYERFKKRYSLHNTKMHDKFKSANQETSKEFLSRLVKLIEEKEYRPEQIFNATETGLFWKRMPKKTFLSKEDKYSPGFKSEKDRMNILLCWNEEGDFVVKPMLVYRKMNPSALKGKDRDQLPVFWRANQSAWITAEVFLEWFHCCFVPDVKIYLESKNMSFKVLLILDNSPNHPENLRVAHPNVEVVFLTSNITSLIQPLDQGIIATFKACYTHQIFHGILDGMEKDVNLTVSQCLQDYTIAECIKNIKVSLDEIMPSTVNICWENFRQEIVNDFCNFPTVKDKMKNIVELGHKIGGDGFNDLQVADVEELLESHDTELNEEEMEELNEAGDSEDDNKDKLVSVLKAQLTLKSLNKGFQLAKELVDLFTAEDPSIERSLQFKKQIEVALVPYKEICEDLYNGTKHLPVSDYFYKSTRTSSTPNSASSCSRPDSDSPASHH